MHGGSLKFCEDLMPFSVELVYINFFILRWSPYVVYISYWSLIFIVKFLDSNENLCPISTALLICSQRFSFCTILIWEQFFIFVAELTLLSIIALLFNFSSFIRIQFFFWEGCFQSAQIANITRCCSIFFHWSHLSTRL